MIVVPTRQRQGPCPRSRLGALVAAIDVEWSKNYRIRGGNVPFCYSVVWLPFVGMVAASRGLGPVLVHLGLRSERPRRGTRRRADSRWRKWRYAGLSQVTSCAVTWVFWPLGHAASRSSRAAARVAATPRRSRSQPRFLDTRYDAGHLLAGGRGGWSMSARNYAWMSPSQNCAALDDRVAPAVAGGPRGGAREKITVLNLRHALSTALVAIRAAEFGCWDPGLNVNQMLAAGRRAGSAGWTVLFSPRCWLAPMVRDCVVLAIEGTHASGKTTLTHALAAHFREQGVHVTTVEEPARGSPFIEDVVVHGKGQFDLVTEVDLFAAQLSAQVRAARQHTMIICDKTIANVMAYARLVLPAPPGSRAAACLEAMEAFCRAWAGVYDGVFYCCDQFAQEQPGDPYRSKVLDLQLAADRVVRATCATVGQHVIDIPPNMTTAGRVRWIATRSPG